MVSAALKKYATGIPLAVIGSIPIADIIDAAPHSFSNTGVQSLSIGNREPEWKYHY